MASSVTSIRTTVASIRHAIKIGMQVEKSDFYNLYVFELEEKSPGWFVTMTIDFESVAITPFESRVRTCGFFLWTTLS